MLAASMCFAKIGRGFVQQVLRESGRDFHWHAFTQANRRDNALAEFPYNPARLKSAMASSGGKMKELC